jgi:hypothetical protein
MAIILFTLIGASALVLGVMNTGQSIFDPLKVDPSATQQFSEAVNGGNTNAAIEALKSKDTDGDGLSDYDEIYIYHTSPYIKDSDSDGIPDGVEVKNGTDPNCPQGQDCGTPAPINANAPASDAADTNQGSSDAATLNGLMNSYETGASGGTDAAVTNDNAPALAPDAGTGTIPTADVTDAAQIRALLKQQGLTDDVLNSLDDQTLVQMYNDSAKTVNGSMANINVNQ